MKTYFGDSCAQFLRGSMRVLLTGAAGFIGYHVAKALLDRGTEVVGIDNVNDYYDVSLKEARLSILCRHSNFLFHRTNIADKDRMLALAGEKFTHIVHLAAQAGVRYSLENPFAYVESNLMGHVVMLELARRIDGLQHFVYASSSSVYGANKKIPFSTEDPVENPVSLYAATKRADELMSATYAHLYQLPSTGLRFFTVYGPWGRPDMATYIFTQKIFSEKPIKVFNHGKMRRDFTYVDDVVSGILSAIEKVPVRGECRLPVAVYNLGNSQSEDLMRFVGVLERAIGKKAIVEFLPMQNGDVPETFADISSSAKDLGFKPKTPIEEGVPRFVQWFKEYHRLV